MVLTGKVTPHGGAEAWKGAGRGRANARARVKRLLLRDEWTRPKADELIAEYEAAHADATDGTADWLKTAAALAYVRSQIFLCTSHEGTDQQTLDS